MSNHVSTSAISSEVYLNIANINRSNVETARDSLEQLIATDDTTGKALVALGYCYYTLKNISKASEILKKALYEYKEDGNPDLWYSIGLIYRKHQKFGLSEPAFMTVLRIEPNHSKKNKVFFELAKYFKNTSRLELSVEYLKNAINNSGKGTEIQIKSYCYLASVYEELKDNKNALEAYRSAHEASKCLKTLACLAWGYLKIDQMETALSMVKASLAEHKNTETKEILNLKYLLVLCLLQKNDIPIATQLIHYLLLKKPNEYSYWLTYGIMYFVTRQNAEAIQCYMKCTMINSNRVEAWFNLGIIYESMGCLTESMNTFGKALSIRTGIASNIEKARNSGTCMYPEIDPVDFFLVEEKDNRIGLTYFPISFYCRNGGVQGTETERR